MTAGHRGERCKLCQRTGQPLRTTHYLAVPTAVKTAARDAGITVPPSRICLDSGDCMMNWPLRR